MRRVTGNRWVAALLVVLTVAACDLLLPSGVQRGGWVWPTPAPLPAGAVSVPLDVAAIPDQVQPDAEYQACPAALLSDFTIAHAPDRPDRPIRYIATDGRELQVRWQPGFSARLAPDLQIVAPDGVIIAREGEVTSGLGGGATGDDETFSVCIGTYTPRRIDPEAT